MSLVVVGLNHKTSPISLLERLSISNDDLPKALHTLLGYQHVDEGIILSTCNRVEVYAEVTRFHGGAQDLRNFLSEFRHVAPEDFSDHLYTYHEEGAIGHLFRVAAGVDSLVVGESEILGQVRRAFQLAEDEGGVQRTLRRAFTQAVRVGRRVRNETGIGRNPASVSSAAVELARRAFSGRGLEGKRVAVVGAGKMGRLAVRSLASAGAVNTTVVNRSEERARAVAHALDAEARPFSALAEVLATADIVICSTTAPQVVIDRRLIDEVMEVRGPSRPLFIVDIAVPRDVDPSIGRTDGIVLRDLDDLKSVVDSSVGSRLSEISKVEEIISAEITTFGKWERSVHLAPAIARLVERSEAMRRAELERLRPQLKELSEEQWNAIDQVTRRIVNKLLHSRLNRLKELAGSGDGPAHREALRELFELDDDLDS